MKELLTQMFTGWALHEASYEHVTETTTAPTRSLENAMTEACGGDALRAQLLCVFGHWANDVLAYAAHYGVGIARKQPDGALLYEDGTVDTLMRGGVMTVVDVPPAPSLQHYWYKGVWNAPDERETDG